MEAAPAESTAGTAAPAEPSHANLSSVLLAFGALFAFTLALPFLSGFDNIMGLVIIAIALYEAWKVNRAARFVVSGPYRVGAVKPSP